MSRRLGFVCLLFICCVFSGSWARSAESVSAIIREKDGSFAERLAAQEIRRYFYLTTGKLLSIDEETDHENPGDLIFVATKDWPHFKNSTELDPSLVQSIEALKPEQYLLKTITRHDRQVLLVAGGDPAGVLYGAYRLAEQLGVRFYLHGDVVPDAKATAAAASRLLRQAVVRRSAASSRFTIFPKGRTGGTSTIIKPTSVNCRKWA